MSSAPTSSTSLEIAKAIAVTQAFAATARSIFLPPYPDFSLRDRLG